MSYKRLWSVGLDADLVPGQLRTARLRGNRSSLYRRLDNVRRNDPDGIDEKKLARLQALRKQVSRPAEPNTTFAPPVDVDAGGSLTLRVEWQIFPPGTVDEVVRFFNKGIKGNRPRDERNLRERVEAFKALQPTAYISGADKFNRYIGAKFAEDLVVFENWRYGNALYIVYENWQEISKRSRIDLLRNGDANFDRIIHTQGWQERLEEIIHRERPLQQRTQT